MFGRLYIPAHVKHTEAVNEKRLENMSGRCKCGVRKQNAPEKWSCNNTTVGSWVTISTVLRTPRSAWWWSVMRKTMLSWLKILVHKGLVKCWFTKVWLPLLSTFQNLYTHFLQVDVCFLLQYSNAPLLSCLFKKWLLSDCNRYHARPITHNARHCHWSIFLLGCTTILL